MKVGQGVVLGFMAGPRMFLLLMVLYVFGVWLVGEMVRSIA